MALRVMTDQSKQGLNIIIIPGIVHHSLFGKTTCDLCGQQTEVESNVYYEPTIDNFFCENCHKLYIDSAIRYSVDIPIELKNYEKIKSSLERVGWWNTDLA